MNDSRNTHPPPVIDIHYIHQCVTVAQRLLFVHNVDPVSVTKTVLGSYKFLKMEHHNSGGTPKIAFRLNFLLQLILLFVVLLLPRAARLLAVVDAQFTDDRLINRIVILQRQTQRFVRRINMGFDGLAASLRRRRRT